MVKLGCGTDGVLNEAKFSEPLPWIGVYIAAASLACAVAMAADVIHGFRHWKLWFPCKSFTINATSLTIITVAVKLSVDLNTPMPRGQDQLAKLSSTALICTVMGNSMPSIGAMENKEILTNILALGILVVTVVVNICIQLGTGVIFVFHLEHAVIMFLMLVLLVVLSFSALIVPTIKHTLELKYKKKYKMAQKECSEANGTDKSLEQKLREALMRYWMMAHTCSPQFVMGRSVTCTASGALCLLSAATLAEAMVRFYLMPGSFKFCKGDSDYKWSINLILLTQAVAVGMGTIAPAIRWFFAINFRCPKGGRKKGHGKGYKLEEYWIRRLVEMKECPLNIPVHNRLCRRIVHDAKVKFLNLCIWIQAGIVFMSKVIRLISIFLMGVILLCYNRCRDWLKKITPENSIGNDSGLESPHSSKLNLSHFVLHLEGEDTLVEVMMKDNRDATDYWRKKAMKRQPKYLMELLELSRPTEGFKGLTEFDSFKVPSLDTEEAPNCWALSLVTLTSIAIAVPNIESNSIKHLIAGVNEGLVYVRNIEDMQRNLVNSRKAANVVWLGVELYHRWLNVDLRKLSLQGKNTKEILEVLSDTGKNRFMEFKKCNANLCLLDGPSKWPIKVLAANSMYRTCQSILLDYEAKNYKTPERLFEAITVMVSDILAACLTNLKQFITTKCSTSSIEEREESVRHAAHVLGRTETILKRLHEKSLPGLNPDQMVVMDEWRSFHKLNSSLHDTHTPGSELASPTPYEVYLTVD
ncbi:ALTERED SEED GERMINATION 7 [Hibiscus trionum]|uniref:ALTERED SEED GERMINATION 7 n=1 Tax=Hibiscus trionum TaxID=183268 RepID=A0A9W7ML51_HIBTR|nr:ALTERED SEED GERMINATION 7 [Hibiscus trionum]